MSVHDVLVARQAVTRDTRKIEIVATEFRGITNVARSARTKSRNRIARHRDVFAFFVNIAIKSRDIPSEKTNQSLGRRVNKGEKSMAIHV